MASPLRTALARLTDQVKKTPLREDIAAASSQLDTKFGVRKEIKLLESVLDSGERAQALCQGTYESKIGLLILTNRRIFLYNERRTGSRKEDFPLKEVDDIEFKRGLMSSKLTVHTSAGPIEFEGVSKDDGKSFADAVQLALGR
jgi:Bacterial PH domain